MSTIRMRRNSDSSDHNMQLDQESNAAGSLTRQTSRSSERSTRQYSLSPTDLSRRQVQQEQGEAMETDVSAKNTIDETAAIVPSPTLSSPLQIKQSKSDVTSLAENKTATKTPPASDVTKDSVEESEQDMRLYSIALSPVYNSCSSDSVVQSNESTGGESELDQDSSSITLSEDEGSNSTTENMRRYSIEIIREYNENSAQSLRQYSRFFRACMICHKTFKKRRYLNLHMKRLHPEQNPYKCRVCNEAFMTSRQMKRHLKVHAPMEEPAALPTTHTTSHATVLSTAHPTVLAPPAFQV